jgi:hypothetical protein|tara:strand:+ start:374 stop:679 length:306 start_codon:yes stop_codon:yes gene_type:complete
MSSHYEKYKETIKRVFKRNYRKRTIWVNEYLSDKFCTYCGESENACLQFHPHEKEIRRTTRKKGLNEEARRDILKLMKTSKIVCANCYLKLENEIIEDLPI